MELKNLPEILVAQDIADYLKISRRKVYDLMQINPDYGGLKNLKIGKSRRVKRADFIQWLEK